MSLKHQMVQSGNYLFRWRGVLPFLFLPVIMLALKDSTYIGNSETLDHLWEVLCLSIGASGVLLRVLTVGFVPARTSGRKLLQQRADTLNTTGMYSVVRHPLYLGNFLIWLGMAAFAHTTWLVVLAVVVFWLYYERIMLAEEEFLRNQFGGQFEEWAQQTPAFLPAFSRWKSPALPFSWRSALARENATLATMIAIFFLLEIMSDFFAGEPLHIDFGWLILICAEAVLYTVVRYLKKHGMLAQEGR